MTPCPRPDCDGTILGTGFCGSCGLEPPAAHTTAFVPGMPASPGPQPEPVVDPEPESTVLENPYVEEQHRFCRWLNCDTPVGRALPGQPAATEGFCHRCGTEFSFTPKLHRGELVGGHYEVLGCLGHGGMGWVYLARDRNLSGKFVVLKGLLTSKDTAALRLARTESRFLTELDHPHIVRIISVIGHPDLDDEAHRYIVMDYVSGRTLKKYIGGAPIRVEDALLWTADILQALIYLHEQKSLLYCDMKPENVIYGSGGLKLIDFGGVRRIGDDTPPFVGTYDYQVTPAEIRDHGLTVRADIYAVGLTLRNLLKAADRDNPELRFGVQSADRLVDRARLEFASRFASAREMLVQVQGVLAEVHSLRHGTESPPDSSAFHEATAALDSGLGQPPPLQRWIAQRRRNPDPPWTELIDSRCPTPLQIASDLAPPREDPNDRHVGYLQAQAPDDTTMLAELDRMARTGNSVELQLRRCRLRIRQNEPVAAAAALDRAKELLRELAPYDWRIDWHAGLIALLEGKTDPEPHFQQVHRSLPGEEDPKLALGLCAELRSDFGRAESLYDVVWKRDRSQISAAFGLVRLRLRTGRRGQAVEILHDVSDRSRHLTAARIAMLRICCGRLRAGEFGLPGDRDLKTAEDALTALSMHAQAQVRLTTVLHEAVLDRLLTAGPRPAFPDSALFGPATHENDVRTELERAYRSLAGQAESRRGHARLVDLANLVRPETLT